MPQGLPEASFSARSMSGRDQPVASSLLEISASDNPLSLQASTYASTWQGTTIPLPVRAAADASLARACLISGGGQCAASNPSMIRSLGIRAALQFLMCARRASGTANWSAGARGWGEGPACSRADCTRNNGPPVEERFRDLRVGVPVATALPHVGRKTFGVKRRLLHLGGDSPFSETF